MFTCLFIKYIGRFRSVFYYLRSVFKRKKKANNKLWRLFLPFLLQKDSHGAARLLLRASVYFSSQRFFVYSSFHSRREKYRNIMQKKNIYIVFFRSETYFLSQPYVFCLKGCTIKCCRVTPVEGAHNQLLHLTGDFVYLSLVFFLNQCRVIPFSKQPSLYLGGSGGDLLGSRLF